MVLILTPVARPQRRRDLGQLGGERLQEADLVEERRLASGPMISTAILAEAMLDENLKISARSAAGAGHGRR
jgi:hypothetical protein